MRIASRYEVLLLGLLSFPVIAGEVVLDNDYVRVTREPASDEQAEVGAYAHRVVIALGDIELLQSAGATRARMTRGDVAVLGPAQVLKVRQGGIFLAVVIKPSHPPAQSAGEHIAPDKNAPLYEGADFFVFEEQLAPGDTRARHSHSDRIVIQLNRARLQQWPDGEPSKFVETVPDRPVFSPPVIHTVRNVGDTPLRGIVIEFKAQ